MTYRIKLDIFEGPLDLLLYLIKKEDVNIYDIPIAEVNEQYLQYLELMQLLDLDIASEFLVMAATLLEIKSKMLLPQDPELEEEVEEDPRAELVNRLLEYQKYKHIAQDLRKKELIHRDIFTRKSQATQGEAGEEVYFEASLFDLISAFSKALKEVPKDVFYEIVKDEVTVEQKIHDILRLLLNGGNLYLGKLFSKSKNKMEIVATFLAILELIRLQEIVVQQETIFGRIVVKRFEEHIRPQRIKANG